MKSYLATAGFALMLMLGGCARQTPQPVAADYSQTQQSSIAGIPVTSAVYESGSNGAVFTEAAYHRRYRRSYARRAYGPRYVVHRRSGRKSAAIIGGSAAGGAAIGALAGGGKGAAIGALVGGGSGLIYDRATHKKVRQY